jgi:hypothetical protein
MMKKLFLLSAFTLVSIYVQAQNLQLHYDVGKYRQYLTSTFEYFNNDKNGNTFMFVDMDYNVGDVNGVSSAYWEVSRSLTFWKAPFAAHFEYNGGFLQWQEYVASGVVQFDDAWLAGVEYNYNDATFSKGLTLMALYKYIRDKHNASFQLTGVWYMNMAKNRVTFSGFADFWREDYIFMQNNIQTKTKYVFMAEPQLWFNFTPHFSAGTELEISNNFAGILGFQVNPTIGVKWNIE